MNASDYFQRPHYFEGKMLTAEDFSKEQGYFLGKLRRHNRYLHGWGVVCGFEVRVRKEKIIVSPGVAVDCAGNEVILETQEVLELPPAQRQFYVTAVYTETLVNPVPTLIPGGISPEEQLQYSLVQEGCLIEISGEDPAKEHEGIGPSTPGCGISHPVPLARIRHTQGGWKVFPLSRIWEQAK
jgi:hypothetical protein